jgi:hypothetical protein
MRRLSHTGQPIAAHLFESAAACSHEDVRTTRATDEVCAAASSSVVTIETAGSMIQAS